MYKSLTHFLVLAAVLLSGEQVTGQQPSEPLIFEGVLRGENVAPAAVDTKASAVVTAVLLGNTLTVSGSFTNLSSPLRDIARSPDDPGVHIHPGARGETNRYIIGLAVVLNGDQRSGIFSGRFTLTDEQVSELKAGRIYVDIHTQANPGGEVRDQLLVGGRGIRAGVDRPKPVATRRSALAPVGGSGVCHGPGAE